MAIVVENSLVTINQRIDSANALIAESLTANLYLLIGVQVPYPANDALVPVPNGSQDYINSIYRNSIAMKKLTAADMALMVPRVDWQAGVTYNFWDDANDMYTTTSFTAIPGTVNVSNSRTVTGTNTFFAANITASGQLVLLLGDGENVAPQILQVTDIFSNTSLNVNTAFVGNFVGNTMYLVTNTSPFRAQNWYVRNSYDQVFVCLNNNNNSPTLANGMPLLSVGGNLPQDPYIITADGYWWKYLYEIPSGNKQQFFSPDWMPVYSDPSAISSAVPGRLDVILISVPGTGYNQNIASNSATILTVVGDGTGANLTAVVNSSGSIIGVNVLEAGEGYTVANIIASTGGTGSGAVFRAIIGPEGGHGADPVHELGASTLMVSQDLTGNEGGTIPVTASGGAGVFEYHQVAILESPVLTSGNIASNLNYSLVSLVGVSPPPAGTFYSIDEMVYQGPQANPSFIGTVVYWDAQSFILWLNNIAGTLTPSAPIIGTLQTSPVTAFTFQEPEVVPFTGRVLYVNNVLPVVRGNNQTEQIRVVLEY